MKRLFSVLFAKPQEDCAAYTPSSNGTPIDQVPMYGGVNRAEIPDLKYADEKLIAETTEHYGSREKAAVAFIGNGFACCQRYDHANAMRRFNQAWLLDPTNAQVYAGFSSVLQNRGKNCKALKMLEESLEYYPRASIGIDNKF